MTVKVSVGTAEKLNKAAAADHTSVAQIIDRLVDRMLTQPETQPNPVAEKPPKPDSNSQSGAA